MGLRIFPYHTIFLLIICLHLGRHLGYIEMLNDARVASLGFFKDNIFTSRINNEKKFKIKFQVLPKFAQILLDYFKGVRFLCTSKEYEVKVVPWLSDLCVRLRTWQPSRSLVGVGLSTVYSVVGGNLIW